MLASAIAAIAALADPQNPREVAVQQHLEPALDRLFGFVTGRYARRFYLS